MLRLRPLALLALALCLGACERPVVEAARPLFEVVSPDPTEALATTRTLLRVRAASFRAVDSVYAAGQLLRRVAGDGDLFEGMLSLTTGLNRVPLAAIDAGGIAGRDTLVLFVVRPVVTSGPALPEPRTGHTATLLRDGRVLVTGGASAAGAAASDAAFVLAPGGSRFTLLGARLPAPRTGHTATLLPDGRVLLAGGTRSDGGRGIGELVEPVVAFDPASGTFAVVPVTGAPVRNTRHAAWAASVAGETRLYVLGGEGDVAYGAQPRFGVRSDLRTFRVLADRVEAVGVGAAQGVGTIFEPLAGLSVTPLTDAFDAPRRVVVAGARTQGTGAEGVGFAVEVAATGQLRETSAPPPRVPRTDHASALLVPGVAGVFGGRQAASGAVADRIELYLAAANRYVVVPASEAAVARTGASATFLGNRRILVVGGLPPGGGALTTSLFFAYDL